MRLAFLGTAHIHTPDFIRRLLARPAPPETLVWDDDPARAVRNAAALEGRVAPLEAILADDLVAGVVICSETARHLDLVTAAAAAGKHMFVEKPLGMGSGDAAAMEAAIQAAGVVFQTGYFSRSQAVQQQVHILLNEGALGEVTRVRLSNCHAGALRGWFDDDWRWMADPARAGVGAFGDLGSHILDLLVWHFGPARKGTATLRNVTGRYGDCDETGEALIVMDNGVIATLAAGWVDESDPVKLHISGTRGHALIRDGSLFVRSENIPGADGTRAWTDLPADLPHPFDSFLDALADPAAASGLIPVAEAAYVSRVMSALYDAAAAGGFVDLGS